MAFDTLSRILDDGKQTLPTTVEAKRLFDASQFNVENVSLKTEPEGFESCCITSVQKLEDCLKNAESTQISFLFLQQKDSWKRIEITYRGFLVLMRRLKIFDPFWSFIKGFGIKFESVDENHIEYKSKYCCNTKVSPIVEKFEICYNIRYFEKHNRPGTKTIWSERQMAVYQNFNILKQTSTWILVQPSISIKNKLKEFLNSAADLGATLSPTDNMSIHLLFLLELAGNWREYINFLDAELMKLDEKALYSNVGGATRRSDYSVTFGDTQHLELIRRKLAKASLILRSNADIGRTWGKEIEELVKHTGAVDIQASLHVIRNYETSLDRHARVIDSLLDRLGGTRSLLVQILEYRNEELSIQTSKDIQDNGYKLTTLTEHATSESQSMTTLTTDIHNDSKLIKTLTFIAVLYTPASLMATIFSSNLVRTVKAASNDESTYMALASDFWKFPVLTFCLIIITFVLALRGHNLWSTCRQKLAIRPASLA